MGSHSPDSSPSPRSRSPRPTSSGDGSTSPPPRVMLRPPTRSNSPRVKFTIDSSGKISRRMSSPPPPPSRPPLFETRVSFDFRDSDYGTNPSFGKSFTYEGYTPRNRARVYLCGTDASDYATQALEYTIQHLMDDGDKLVCVRAVEKDSARGKSVLLDKAKYSEIVDALISQLKKMLEKNGGPAISVQIDTVLGSVGRLLIEDMVRLHDPMCIVIGTKGEGGAKKQLGVKKSISEYLYKFSPVPLIIVRIPSKRNFYFQERQKDRNRERYSTPLGESMVDSQGRVTPAPAPEASPEESKRVREAMKMQSTDIPHLRHLLNTKVSKKKYRLTPPDVDEEHLIGSEESEDILSLPPSRSTSPEGSQPERRRSTEVLRSQEQEDAAVRGSQDTVEDDDFGESLTRTASKGGILQADSTAREPGKQFHEMPNYDERVLRLMENLEHRKGVGESPSGSPRRRPSIRWKDQELIEPKEVSSAESERPPEADGDGDGPTQPPNVSKPEDTESSRKENDDPSVQRGVSDVAPETTPDPLGPAKVVEEAEGRTQAESSNKDTKTTETDAGESAVNPKSEHLIVEVGSIHLRGI